MKTEDEALRTIAFLSNELRLAALKIDAYTEATRLLQGRERDLRADLQLAKDGRTAIESGIAVLQLRVDELEAENGQLRNVVQALEVSTIESRCGAAVG